MILSLITILSISIINSDSIDPEECMKNYINSIQNQTFKHFLTDDFAVYNCGGKQISDSDFQREELRKLWDGLTPIPIREYKIKSVNQTKFNVEVQFAVRGEKKVANIEIETTISDKVCRIKSERQQKYFSRDRKHYSSFLIDYEELFGKKAQKMLEEYIGNLEIGEFPKNFKIVRRFSKNSTAIIPLHKLIHKKIPTISSNRYFIEQSYEPNLDFLVTIDDGKLKVAFFVVINDQGDFEIRIERQPHWETQESIIPWFTSAFIDYPRTYERIVEELIEKFRNAIKTKEIEDEIFSIVNLTSSEMGYFSSFYSVLYYDIIPEKQQFSYQNYDEKQLEFSINFENNKFNLLIDEEMTMLDYFNRIYEDCARNLMEEYKNVLLLAYQNEDIFNENFKLCDCSKGCMNFTQFSKQLKKPGNIVDFDNWDEIEFVSVNKTNGDIEFLKNRKSRFIAKYSFDRKRYEFAVEIRCKNNFTGDFLNAGNWYKPLDNEVEWNDFENKEPLVIFGSGWMFDHKPSIIPYKNFDLKLDVSNLKEALDLSLDSELIRIVCHRSQSQRHQINLEYNRLYKKDLKIVLEKKLIGNFKKLMISLFEHPAVFDAHVIYKQGSHTRGFPTLTEIFLTRSNQEIEEIAQAFHLVRETRMPSRQNDSLYDYMCRFDADKLSVAKLVEVHRDESLLMNRTRAMEDARRLIDALNTPEAEKVLTEIFTKTNLVQLKLIFKKFYEQSGKTVRQILESVFLRAGNMIDFARTTIDITQDRLKYFSDKLDSHMRGAGTTDIELIRIIVGYAERNLESIREEFDRRHPEESLVGWISEDTSGSFRDALIALIKGNRNQ